jgi:S-(hydroxymethyl)glutathione dehydrogenase / alcohol dehydrogenase
MNFSAAVLRQIGKPLAIETLSLRGLTEKDVVVRIKATSLCHTDLEAVEGALGTPAPFIPGHEAAGIVESVGKEVAHLKPGDHVVVSWNPYCGTCYFCQRQQRIICSQYRANSGKSFHFDGAPRIYANNDPVHQLMYAGSFSEIVVVTEECAVKVPKELPFEVACLIGCGVMTGVGAILNIAQLPAEATVAVIGCGAVGLSAIQGAKLAHAGKILAIDRDPMKLQTAKAFGATEILLADDNAIDACMQMTHQIGFDCVIESAGNEAAFQLSVEIVRPGGKTVWLGKVPVNQKVSFRWGSLMGEKKIHRSSYGGTRPEIDFPYLADAYFSGKLLLDEYITSRIGLADVNEGLARLKEGKEIRSVILLN